MIGIVVVSHSRALADAAVSLAQEMVEESAGPEVMVAAGLDENTFGTDASAVSAAIEEVDSADGVLVLLDLGSAVLSAEMALEFLDPDVAARVRLSSAPLVEGLVAAVVLASTGADLDAVAQEAQQGLLGKRSHLDTTEGSPPAEGEGDSGAADVTREIRVANAHGLHARPAAKVVALVRGFDATVTLANLDAGRGPVNAASLSAVATLDARQGNQLRVAASGPDAEQAVQAFAELAARSFDDGGTAGSAAPPTTRAAGSGLDLAMGPALVQRSDVDVSAYEPGSTAEETQRSRDAVSAVRRRLEELERRTTEESGTDAGAIFAAHLALLDDPDVCAGVEADLESGVSAVDAWRGRLDAVAAGFDGLADAYQRERAADVRSVHGALLRALTDQDDEDGTDPADESPVILIVHELDAATAASIDVAAVAGVVTIARGTTGHGVIVASSRGIPLLTGAGDGVAGVRSGQVVAFDARGDAFFAEMSEEDRHRFPDLVGERRRERDEVVEAARGSASTSDGVRVPVLANVGSLADAESAAANGADGSGLVRTEVLFGDREAAPGVDEQAETFLALAKALGGTKLTIRTWDVGGDKPLPFLPLPPEPNPFLGVRGMRAFSGGADDDSSKKLLDDQLAAICRAARETPLRVMFPMVTNREEIDRARQQLLDAAGGLLPDDLEVGIMVEVPAAATLVDVLAVGLDFVSIGTNDLTQYTVAADRGNDAVASLADPISPAVFRMIDLVCRTRPEDVEVALCGDLASRPLLTPLLLGLGVEELSCTAPTVPEVKAAVRRTDLREAKTLAAAVLRTADRDEILALLSPAGPSRG